MRACGAGYREIGANFGVSANRARQYVCQGDFEYSHITIITIYGESALGFPERTDGWSGLKGGA